jgi:hypothetical protein
MLYNAIPVIAVVIGSAAHQTPKQPDAIKSQPKLGLIEYCTRGKRFHVAVWNVIPTYLAVGKVKPSASREPLNKYGIVQNSAHKLIIIKINRLLKRSTKNY